MANTQDVIKWNPPKPIPLGTILTDLDITKTSSNNTLLFSLFFLTFQKTQSHAKNSG